jgi:hypothetical protein
MIWFKIEVEREVDSGMNEVDVRLFEGKRLTTEITT